MIRACSLAIILFSAASAQPLDGERPYQIRCSGCHADDGAGAAHGPAIRASHAATCEAVVALILKGVPDSGMPAFTFSDAEAIAAYVLTLKRPAAATTTAPVNPDAPPLGPDIAHPKRPAPGPPTTAA